MSIDGANIGTLPSRALRTILGGEPSPPKDDQNARNELAGLVAAAIEPPDRKGSYGDTEYDLASLYLANRMLPLMQSQPDLDMDQCYDEAKKRGMEDVGATGFMVGWAFNCVRTLLGMPETENPAIITIK